MKANNARTTGPALVRMQQFLLWLAPTVEKFPRSQKFLLGDRIQSTALDVLEHIVEAAYTRARARQLQAANLGVEKLRILFRLAADLHVLDLRRYEHAARSLDEAWKAHAGFALSVRCTKAVLEPPNLSGLRNLQSDSNIR